MNPFSKSGYASLLNSETKWNDDESNKTSSDNRQEQSGLKYLYAPFVIFTASFAIGVAAGIFLAFKIVQTNATGDGPSNVASYPVWRNDINDFTTSWTRFNGSLYAGNKYRGAPNPGLDYEWDRFTDFEFASGSPLILGVTADELHLSKNDFSQSTAVELDPDNGGPGYMASLEMFHTLHCLNFLRKWTYIDYYRGIDHFWREANHFHQREHADHCIDMLRQVLMCYSDTSLVVSHWTKKTETPTPYFSTAHKCRDPEQILAWAQSIAKPIHRAVTKKGTENELEDFPP